MAHPVLTIFVVCLIAAIMSSLIDHRLMLNAKRGTADNATWSDEPPDDTH